MSGESMGCLVQDKAYPSADEYGNSDKEEQETRSFERIKLVGCLANRIVMIGRNPLIRQRFCIIRHRITIANRCWRTAWTSGDLSRRGRGDFGCATDYAGIRGLPASIRAAVSRACGPIGMIASNGVAPKAKVHL